MAAKKKSPAAMNYIVSYLKRKPAASYSEISQGAKKRNLTVYPIMYGRAKALLGLVPTKPRGSKKAKKAKKAKRGKTVRRKKTTARAAGRGGRGGGSPIDTLQDLVTGMREQERANDELRKTLERIQEMIDRVV